MASGCGGAGWDAPTSTAASPRRRRRSGSAQLRGQARGEIKRLQTEVGTTTVYVTHDQVEALTLGDLIAVLDDGALQQVGTPEALYERPANVFVGGFIGSPVMSFMPGENGAVVGGVPEHVPLWADGLRGPIDGRVAYDEALGLVESGLRRFGPDGRLV